MSESKTTLDKLKDEAAQQGIDPANVSPTSIYTSRQYMNQKPITQGEQVEAKAEDESKKPVDTKPLSKEARETEKLSSRKGNK